MSKEWISRKKMPWERRGRKKVIGVNIFTQRATVYCSIDHWLWDTFYSLRFFPFFLSFSLFRTSQSGSERRVDVDGWKEDSRKGKGLICYLGRLRGVLCRRLFGIPGGYTGKSKTEEWGGNRCYCHGFECASCGMTGHTVSGSLTSLSHIIVIETPSIDMSPCKLELFPGTFCFKTS